MDPRAALITDIDTQLRHYLGQGVDAHRTLVDARYARDVLLVCDGMTGTDLPQLAAQFRQASRDVRVMLPVLRAAVQSETEPTQPSNDISHASGHDAGPPQGWSRNTSGFGHSHPPIADFNLSPRNGAGDAEVSVGGRRGNLIAPLDANGAYHLGNKPPWYSWRRWWFNDRI